MNPNLKVIVAGLVMIAGIVGSVISQVPAYAVIGVIGGYLIVRVG
jgi:hypothetical protein